MKVLFRSLVVAAAFIYAVWYFFPQFGFPLYGEEEIAAFQYQGHGAFPLFASNFALVFPFAWLIAAAGLIVFRPWARQLYFVLEVVAILTGPFYGMSVMLGVEHTLFSAMSMLDGAIIALAYLSPIAGEFDAAAT